MSKKFHIRTYGCQMNVYDSERMSELMAGQGYEPTEEIADADLVVLNTCHIREKAAEKVYSELGRIRALKEQRQASGYDMVIAVAGCVGQAEGELITQRAPCVDIVLGPQTYHRLPDMVMRARRDGQSVVELDFTVEEKFDSLPEEGAGHSAASFLSIQEGCDKFCTFCVVPYTRGAEFSRPAAAIMREAIARVARGAVELTLLGQNVNAYHGEGLNGDEMTLAGLIRQLAEIEGLERIRYTTSHPRDMSDDLIAVHGEIPQLMPYLHLPIQSGSDRVLKAMNRKHTASEYIKIIDRLRQARPDIALSSDFIVGFPGETDEDFENTLRLVEHVTYAQAYSFKYSPRPGTPAADSTEQVPESVKSERLDRLQALLNRQQQAFNAQCVGKQMRILLERPGKYAGQMIGKSPYLQSVCVTADGLLAGQMVEVAITEAHTNSLVGEKI